MIYIYKLSHPITNEIKYVGKTVNLKKRLQSHMDYARSGLKKRYLYDWINSLLKDNIKPIIEVLEVCSEDNWVSREVYWIAHFKENGCKLCNLTDGGESNTGYVYSDELKLVRKIARAGKNLPDSTKQKISNTLCKPITCSNGLVFKSMKEAISYSGVPKSTFHRKLHKKEEVNGNLYQYNTNYPLTQ